MSKCPECGYPEDMASPICRRELPIHPTEKDLLRARVAELEGALRQFRKDCYCRDDEEGRNQCDNCNSADTALNFTAPSQFVSLAEVEAAVREEAIESGWPKWVWDEVHTVLARLRRVRE